MLYRVSVIVITLLAIVLVACSGPDSPPTELPAVEPSTTSTATPEPSSTPTVAPSPSPSPSPAPAPSPTPVPICNEAEVAALLETLVAAFNTGDWARLSALLPVASFASAPEPPEPGMDTSLFRGSRITTVAYSGEESTAQLASGAELIAHLQRRQALGERWQGGDTNVEPYDRDPSWNMPDAAAVEIAIIRGADDLAERSSVGSAVVNCRDGTVIFWQLTDDPLPPIAILSLSLNDIDNEPLRFLSADEHPYFDGYTLVHGALQVAGAGQLSEVVLEVVEAGAVIATGELIDSAREQLVGPFDERGYREIAAVQPLFRIDSTQFQAADRDNDGWLTLRVRATTANGDAVTLEYETEVGKLVLYRGENRYILDEENRGGNDWVQPSVRDIISSWANVTLGDFSDMNGGPYPPHVTHQTGLDVDVWFLGYNEMDAFTAETLLAYIDGQSYTSRIDLIFAAFEPVAGNPFWDVITGYTLSDGRPAASVILPEAGHTGHFHIRFNSLLDE